MSCFKRVLLAISACCVMAFLSLGTVLATGSDANGDGYDDNDFNKIQAFLNQPSPLAGKTNGLRLSASYDPDDPLTWLVQWDESSPKRVRLIFWTDGEPLAGSLDLSGFESLVEVNVDGNQITSLNVEGATSLKILSCNQNLLSALDVSTNTALITLYCGGNSLQSLDVSHNTALEYLGCDNTGLKALELSHNPALMYLIASDNAITALDVSGNPELLVLHCEGNPLTSLKASLKGKGGVQLQANGNGFVSMYCHDEKYYVQATPKGGYTFKDWTSSGSIVSTSAKLDLTAGNYTLQANFPSTVCFDSQSGSPVDSVTAGYNATISAPPTPIYKGHSFGGWYKEAECTNVWNFQTDRVTKNTTLYAKWTADTYTVAFNTQGGSKVESKTAQYNATVTAPANPALTGHTFVGWYREAECANRWNFASDTVKDNVTLYAKWSVNAYKVAFDSKGGSQIASVNVEYNSTFAVPVPPTYPGNTFGGWYKEAACIDAWNFQTDRVTGNVTLYAKWGTNQTVTTKTSNTKYGTVAGSGIYGNGLLATVTAIPKNGYCFTKWMDGKKVVSYGSIYTFAVSGNRTLVAYFSAIKAPFVSVKATGYSTVSVSWKAVPYAKGYQVLRSTNRRNGFKVIATVEGALSLADRGLPSGYTYYYQARAYSAAGNVTTFGGYSSAKSVTPKWPSIKAKAKAQNHHSVLVSWNAIAGAVGYDVFAGTSSRGQFTPAATDVTANSYLVQGLQAGRAYYFKVRAYDVVNGVKVYSPFGSYASAKPVWPTISLKAGLSGYNGAFLGWNAISAADGYELFRSTSSRSGFMQIGGDISGTSYADMMPEGRTYYYKVRPFDVVGGVKLYGSYSSVKSITPKWPAIKISRVASQGYYAAIVNWNAIANVSGYEVWRSTSGKSGFAIVGTTETNSFLNEGLSKATYYYKVRAFVKMNENTVYGPFSGVKSVTIKEDFWMAAGLYRVGTDIPAGEYYFVAVDPKCLGYMEIAMDTGGELSGIVKNEAFTNNYMATVHDGEYLEVVKAKFALSSYVKPQPSTTGFLRVGLDIPAGQKTLRSNDDLYSAFYCVYSSTRHLGFENAVTYATFTGSKTISVENGQYLYLDRCDLRD